MRRPAATWTSLFAAVSLLAAGCAGGDGVRQEPRDAGAPTLASPVASSKAGPLASFYGQRLRWSGCRGGFECARLEVPLDYRAPRQKTIKIAVVRLRSRDGDRHGSLVLNPGGPGASGIDYARAAQIVVSGAVRDRYDIVGFDPRGVRRSAPVDCLTDSQLDSFLTVDGSPDSPAEEDVLSRESRALGSGCAQRRPALARHIGTRDVARDLDVLRAALGDRRLNYLGKSYGTYLGLTYAELFPRRVGRLVLDGPLDPSSTSIEVSEGQAGGFQRAFEAFLADCVKRSSCPFSGSVDEAEKQAGALLQQVDAQPLRGENSRPVTQALAVIGVAAALYDEGSWGVLRQAFAQAQGGNGATFLALADYYSDRGPDGRYTTNSVEALYAVNCLDRPEESDLAAFRAAALDMERISPVFGAFLAWGGLPCATWPYPAQGRPHPIAAKGAAPILIVGTTRDPATPYEWAVAAESQLAAGRLLTFEGDGHTAYRRGSSCIDRSVDRYLVDGKLPAEGARCR